MIQTIENLPNCNRSPFSKKDWAICGLDNYAVYNMSEIERALWGRGYVLVLMGGGITSFIQQNNTFIHHPLKSHYRNSESARVNEKLQANKSKVPSPTQDETF